MKKKSFVFYCNWGVSECNSSYFISATHDAYIQEVLKYYDDVILISKETAKSDSHSSQINKNVRVVLLPRFKNYADSFKYFFEIRKVIKNCVVDDAIYYIRSPEPFSWLFHFYCKKNTNVSLIYHYMSNPIEAIFNKVSDHYLTRLAKFIFYFPDFYFTSLVAKKNFVSCNGLGLKNKLMYFVGNNCTVLDESLLKESDYNLDVNTFDKSAVNILYVGILRSAKGLDFLIDAIFELKKSIDINLSLDIVGDGEYKPQLMELIRRRGLSESVNFHGFVPYGEELLSFYRKSNLFILPSLTEGSPRVILEAMANSLPCISTDVGNISNLLADNRGICIPPSDHLAIKNAILTIVSDMELQKKFIENSYDFSRERSLEKFFNKFMKIGI